jgi:23S rRNA pseudouridine1911/1915/1917 synthase
MQREYVAFVEGRPAVPKGTWRQWLQLSKDEMRQHVLTEEQAKAAMERPIGNVQEVREAITHYETIKLYPLANSKGFVSKLRLRLETGRKHQIRVQAANAGLPLIGDRTYNPKYRGEFDAATRIDFARQALHAEVLSLEHPEQPGKRMTWAAELPKDLRQLEAALREGRPP